MHGPQAANPGAGGCGRRHLGYDVAVKRRPHGPRTSSPAGPEPAREPAAGFLKAGRLVRGSRPGALLVALDGDTALPRAARALVALDEVSIHRAVESARPIALMFLDGDPALPVILGFLDPAPGEGLLADLLSRSPASTATATPRATADVVPPSPDAPNAPASVQARVDGHRVVIEGEREVVLKCGEASVTLTRDGKILLRGAYVETNARGVNRIKGGSVKIN